MAKALPNLGASASDGWVGEGVSVEVLIKWKEVIIKFTAVPQSTTVCALLITYTGPRWRKWQPWQWFMRYLDNPRGVRYELRARAVIQTPRVPLELLFHHQSHRLPYQGHRQNRRFPNPSQFLPSPRHQTDLLPAGAGTALASIPESGKWGNAAASLQVHSPCHRIRTRILPSNLSFHPDFFPFLIWKFFVSLKNPSPCFQESRRKQCKGYSSNTLIFVPANGMFFFPWSLLCIAFPLCFINEQIYCNH